MRKIALTFYAIVISQFVSQAQFIEVPYNINGPHDAETVKTPPDPNIHVVGVTPGTPLVTESGAATYTIPFEVPPGTMNMVPSLSLVYNSQAGNGLFGYGWSLSGLSAITRGNKQYYAEGTVDCPESLPEDAVYLDGQRMVYRSGPSGPGYEHAFYYKRVDDRSHITAVGQQQEGPECYKVTKPDGRTYYYGCDNGITAAQYSHEGNGGIADWMYLISKVEDCDGNYMVYHYYDQETEGTEAPLIKNIKYTGNVSAGINPYNEIKFYYLERTIDPVTSYRGGTPMTNSKYLVDRIEIWGEDPTSPTGPAVKIKTYVFNYASYDNKSVLNEVRECAPTQGCKSPTKIRYGQIGTEYVENTTDLISTLSTPDKFISGDFNGDGYSDVIQMIDNGFDQLACYAVFLNDPTTSTTGYLSSSNLEHYDCAGGTQHYSYWTNQNGFANIGDFDGDGYDDVFFQVLEEQSSSIPYIKSFSVNYGPVSLNNGGWNETNTYNTVTTPSSNLVPFPASPENGANAVVGDIDGDGRSDVITFHAEKDVLWNNTFVEARVHLKGGDEPFDRNIILVDNNSNEVDFLLYHQFELIDYDGNGDLELLMFGASFFYVLDLEVSGIGTSSVECIANLVQQFPLGLWTEHFTGDFNGDAITDILFTDAEFDDWMLATGTGANVGSSNSQYILSSQTGEIVDPNDVYNAPWRYYVHDLDGDGLSDLIMQRSVTQANQSSRFYVQRSLGDRFQEIPNSYYLASETFVGNSTPVNHQLFFGDFDGDGSIDLLTPNPSLSKFEQVTFWPGKRSRFVEEIVDGLGNETDFVYGPLTYGAALNNGYFYQKGSEVSFPYCKIQSPLYVVESALFQDAQESQITTIYEYEGMVLHRQGLGILGFDRVKRINQFNSLSTENMYSLEENVATRLLQSSTLKDQTAQLGNVDGYISSTEYPDYETHIYPPIPSSGPDYLNHFSRILKKVDNNVLTSSKDVTEYTYDNWLDDFVSQIEKEIGVEVCFACTSTVGQMNITKAYETRLFDCNGRYNGMSESSSTTVTRAGETSFSLSSNIDFNLGTSKINSITKRQGTSGEITTTYSSYDAFGHPTSISVSVAGETPRNSSVIYDTKGRWIINTSNALSQSFPNDQVYHPHWGKPKIKFSLSGNATQYSFDEFGRQTLSTDPLGINTTTTYEWDLATGTPNGQNFSEPDNKVFYIETNRSGQPTSRTYLDKHLQKRAEWVSVFSSPTTFTKVVYTYDVYGRVKKVSTPHQVSSNAEKTEYFYDAIGRKTGEKKDWISQATTIEYPFLGQHVHEKITTPEGDIYHKKSDMTGALIEAIDPNGTIEYSYNSKGLVETVVDNVSVSTMGYDDCGRQNNLTDASAGTNTYKYNGYDELIKQTDALSNEVNNSYDVLGRIEERQDVLGLVMSTTTTTYDYVSSGNGLNQLEQVTQGSHYKSYTYDAYDRLIQTLNSEGAVYEDYSYNSFGQLQERDISGNITFSYAYQYGYLDIIQCQTSDESTATVLFDALAQDHLGNYTDYVQANGITTIDEYDDYGHLEGTFASGVFDYDYDWDIEENLLNSRTDVIQNQTESFTYTTQRLTGINTNGSLTAQVINYSNTGNITDKYDAGSYGYNGPYKLSSIENDPAYISTEQQNISYNSYNEPKQISENDYTLDFQYGADFTRLNSTLSQIDPQTAAITGIEGRTYYPEFGYERIEDQSNGDKYHVFYESVGGRLIGMVIKKIQGGNLVTPPGEGYYAVYTDYLGSILKVDDGQTSYNQSFDAWGRKRDHTDWANYSGLSPTPMWLIRGYTAHEQLDQFALIHMNGRLYDPIAGRMRSVDNYVQFPGLSDGYNRYSYGLNNPLKYTDPSGELIWVPILVGAAVGGVINLGVQAYSGNINSVGDGLVAFGIGAIAGGVSVIAPQAIGTFAGIGLTTAGGGVAAGFVPGAIAGGAGGLVGGFGNSLYFNYDSERSVTSNIGSAAVDGAIGAGFGVLTGGLIGGVSAKLQGKPFLGTPAKDLSHYTQVPKQKGDGSWDWDRMKWRNTNDPASGFKNLQINTDDGYINVQAKDITNPGAKSPNYLVSNETSPSEFRNFVTNGTGGNTTNRGFTYTVRGEGQRWVGYGDATSSGSATISLQTLDKGAYIGIAFKFRWDHFFYFR